LLGVPAHDPQPTRLQGDGWVSLSPERLRLRRLWKRMSQRAVAERAGLSVPHYHNLERGVVKRARRETADRVAKALGCRIGNIAARAGHARRGSVQAAARPVSAAALPARRRASMRPTG
jgi:transcriptional regulator with XRE-family HTH domain